MNEVLDVMVMMMLVFLESLSPGLDENFGLVTQFPEVVMMVRGGVLRKSRSR